MTVSRTAELRETRVRRASLYRLLRRLHLWITFATALPLVLLSLSGALLVFGHELEQLIEPPTRIDISTETVLPFSTLIERIAEQKPDLHPWAFSPSEHADEPWRVWLAGGNGALDLDPRTGEVIRHYYPGKTPYGFVKALHRRWLVDGKPASDWSRTTISIVSLTLMLQVLVGIWMWAIPPRRLERLKPESARSTRLAVQRLHMLAGVVTAAILLLVAFTGLSMYWSDSTKGIVETLTASKVENLEKPATAGLDPVADIDAAVALARSLIPEATLISVRPPEKPGDPVHIGLRTDERGVVSRAWLGDDPVRVLAFFDGRQASAATRFWQFRYWLHIGDFAGWPVRVIWLIAALTPTAFVASGLWLWFERRRKRDATAPA